MKLHVKLGSASVAAVVTALMTLGAPGAVAADQTFRGHWTLDEIGSPTAFDSSGYGNNGTNYNVTGDGSGYAFNGVNSRVIVPTSDSLNPGAANFSFGVTVSMVKPPPQLGETYDVLRKGLVTTKGGNYKIEVKNVKGKAKARCVVKSYRTNGTKVLAAIQGTSSLADGAQHAITCVKTSTGIALYVDALAPRTKNFSGGLGSVANTSVLALGAKGEDTAKTGFDWFEGNIYDAWVASP